MQRCPSGDALRRAASAAAVPLAGTVRRSLRAARALAARPLHSLARSVRQRSLQVLSAAVAAGAPLQRSGSDANLSIDLDWRPELSGAQEVACWSGAAAVACVLYALTAPPAVSIPYATTIGLLFGLALYFLRGRLLEESYKARERIEADLGDPDSRFRDINNLAVHVKVKAARSVPLPVAATPAAARYAPPPLRAGGAPLPALHCFHGFGSNVWSWSLVQQQIAERLGALVTAHDMPGFGLTQRPTELSGYFLSFNGRLGRLVLDYELAIRGLISRAEALRSGESGYPHTSVHQEQQELVQDLQAAAGGSPCAAASQAVGAGLEPASQAAGAAAAQGDVAGAAKAALSGSLPGAGGAGGGPGGRAAAQRVLVGHSLGGACAALEYIANPRDYAAVVLVDPAILTGLGGGGERGKPGAPVQLERLQDGTALTRSQGGGGGEQPAAANGSGAGSSSSSSADLDELAAAQGNLARSASATGSSSGSDSDGRRAGAAAADEVVVYATRGDDAHFSALQQQRGAAAPGGPVGALLGGVLGVLRSAVMLSTLLVLSALRPLIVVLLRVAVRSRGFWASTLEQAYYDKGKVTPQAVDAYRLPQLVRGWEAGMVQFLIARLGGGATRGATTAAGAAGAAPLGGLEDSGLAARFAAAVAATGTPVLIVHGAGDKLVPVSNSFNLARLIKGCRLAVIKRAGHVPQEEEPQLFADVVCSFLGKRLGV